MYGAELVSQCEGETSDKGPGESVTYPYGRLRTDEWYDGNLVTVKADQ